MNFQVCEFMFRLFVGFIGRQNRKSNDVKLFCADTCFLFIAKLFNNVIYIWLNVQHEENFSTSELHGLNYHKSFMQKSLKIRIFYNSMDIYGNVKFYEFYEFFEI